MIAPKTRQFAEDVFRRFEAIPVKPDGSIDIPPDVYRDLVDLAPAETEGPAKQRTHAMLSMLIRLPVERRRREARILRQLEGRGK